VTARDCGSKMHLRQRRAIGAAGRTQLKGATNWRSATGIRGPLDRQRQRQEEAQDSQRTGGRRPIGRDTAGEREDDDVASWLDDEEDEEEIDEPSASSAEAKKADTHRRSRTREIPPPVEDTLHGCSRRCLAKRRRRSHFRQQSRRRADMLKHSFKPRTR